MKVLLSAVILLTILLTPAGSTLKTSDIVQTQEMCAVIPEESTEDDGVAVTMEDLYKQPRFCDPKMHLQPGDNCDPDMLIEVTPDNDPGFMMEPSP